jgi:hypothetical protein
MEMGGYKAGYHNGQTVTWKGIKRHRENQWRITAVEKEQWKHAEWEKRNNETTNNMEPAGKVTRREKRAIRQI